MVPAMLIYSIFNSPSTSKLILAMLLLLAFYLLIYLSLVIFLRDIAKKEVVILKAIEKRRDLK